MSQHKTAPRMENALVFYLINTSLPARDFAHVLALELLQLSIADVMSRSQFHSIKLFILRHAWLNL